MGNQVSQPSVTVVLANADAAVQNTVQKVLAVGQKTASGSATAGALTVNVGSNFDALFGARSQLAGLVRAYKAVNEVVQIDCIALADAGGGVPRVLDFTVVGPSTAAGSITLVLGDEVNHKIVVPIASGDSATVIGNAITAAAALDLKAPFTVSNVAGAVTITAANDGTVANFLGVEVIVDAVGVSVASLVETTAGATNPSLTSLFDVATDRYQGVIFPYLPGTILTTYLDARFNPTNAVEDGVGFIMNVDTHANLLTALGLLNSQSLVSFVDKLESETLYIGPSQNFPTYAKLATFAGIRALRLTEGQSIARFVTSSASLDQFGGIALASLPYFNTTLPGFPLIKTGRGFTRTEVEQLLAAGGSITGVNVAGNTSITGEVVTTFKTDSAGNPDVTFSFLNYVDTASQVREYFFNNLKSQFAQSRLVEGAISRGRDMANAGSIAAFMDKLYGDLAGPSKVLLQDGEAALVFFKANRTVTLDLSTGTVTATALIPIVVQLRTINMTLKVAFSITG